MESDPRPPSKGGWPMDRSAGNRTIVSGAMSLLQTNRVWDTVWN